MPDSNDTDRNIRFYTGLVEKHGVDVRSLNWGSAESQRLRFKVLAEVGLEDGASLLDVGCGLGDLYAWLRDTGRRVEYSGIDVTPKMIETARCRFPEGRFDLANLLETKFAPVDYVFASGIFYLREDAPFEFMKAMIASMFGICRKAVAFNSLSAWAGDRDAVEFLADPAEVLAFCRKVTPWVTLRHDYHGRDFTIYLRREAIRA